MGFARKIGCVALRICPLTYFTFDQELLLRALIAKEGTEAFNEKVERPYMRKTQQRHEGRPPPRKPRMENVTANQKRCQALRACGFEEDNGDDSDEDLAPGMCGCNLTECQKMHKNETDDRRAWKIFHVKYAKELDERW
jgi:hypothetical protein